MIDYSKLNCIEFLRRFNKLVSYYNTIFKPHAFILLHWPQKMKKTLTETPSQFPPIFKTLKTVLCSTGKTTSPSKLPKRRNVDKLYRRHTIYQQTLFVTDQSRRHQTTVMVDSWNRARIYQVDKFCRQIEKCRRKELSFRTTDRTSTTDVILEETENLSFKNFLQMI